MATKLPRITYEDKKDYKVIEQDPTYCISAKDMNDIKNTFNQSAGMIENAVDTTNQTNQTINEKIEDGSFVPQATAGTVEMTQPGTKAEVTITGDKKNPEFNFRIPKNEIDDSEDIKKALLQGTYTTDLSEEYKGVASDYGAEILKIEGKSEQVTTNGYQLFDASKLPTKTQGGATVTNNGDGSFTISGSGNLTEVFSLGYTLSHEQSVKLLNVGELTLKDVNNTFPYFQVKIASATGNIYLGYTNNTVKITQEHLNDQSMKITILFYGEIGKKIINAKIKPMLYQDGDGTWEPFTGGMPSPNPNYPQEINNALDEPLVSVGRNLCNDKYGYSYSKIYNYISSKSNIKYAFKKMKPKTKYTMFLYGISFIKKINSFGIKDANSKNPNSTGGSFGGLSKCVFETTDISNPIDNNVLFFSMSVSKLTESEQAELPNMKVMIVEGDYSSDDLPYEPHHYAETNLNFQQMCSVPDGTCDTYENGVSTQRIGLYGFNGGNHENWIVEKCNIGNRFVIDLPQIQKAVQSHIGKETSINSALPLGVSGATFNTKNCYTINNNKLYVSLNGTETLEEFKQYLSKIEMQLLYKLETPIVLEVEKPIVPTFNPYTNIYQSDDVKAKIQYGLRSKVDECPYDIGDLYITMNEILPSVKWKGTKWERVEGFVPVGYKESDADFGTLGKTGGAKTVTLTEEQMPEHGHQAKAKKAGNHKHGIALKTATGSATPHTGAGIKEGSWSSTDTHAWLDKGLCEELGEHDHVITVENAGGSQAHNNLQPYKVFNMWLRTK